MSDRENFVEFEVELDKVDVEFLDKLAATRGCDRSAIINEAVALFIDRHRHLLGRSGRETKNE